MAQASEVAGNEETLDDLRLRMAPFIAHAAVFDGWTQAAVAQGAVDAGIDGDVAAYAFREGPMTMIAAWIAHVDTVMLSNVSAERLAGLPVREKIRTLVLARLDAVSGMEEALSRALSIMAMPRNAAEALRMGWASADLMWRRAGDTSTDYNYYTKRTILAGVYAATLSVFASDKSEGKADTHAFLDRRIEGIIRFEKAKAQLLKTPDERFSMARFLGRLRYPSR